MLGGSFMVFIVGAIMGFMLGNGTTLGILQRMIGYP